MAIEKNSFKVSRLESEFSPRGTKIMSSGDDEILRRGLGEESDNDDVINDCDSGAGSDDFDLMELGEVGEEFCHVADQTCSIPLDLYDLSGLSEILCMEVWNECLTEEERFSLTKYLPDLDQEMYLRTLKQLLIGSNMHFGSPLSKLFDMMKGGLCEPRVSLYRQGMMYFQKRQHSHFVRKYHNKMTVDLHQIKDAWLSCNGYSIKEKLQVLNIVKSQKSLMNENVEVLGSDASEGKEAGGVFWRKKKNLMLPYQDKAMRLREEKLEMTNPKGSPTFAGTKTSFSKDVGHPFPSGDNDLEMMSSRSDLYLRASRQNMFAGYGLEAKVPMRGGIKNAYNEETRHETSGPLMIGKKIEGLKYDEYSNDYFMGYPGSSRKDLHPHADKRIVDKLSDIKFLTSKPSKTRRFDDMVKYPVNTSYAKNSLLTSSRYDSYNGFDPFLQNKAHREAFSTDMSPVYESGSSDYKLADRRYFPEYHSKYLQENSRANFMQNGGHMRRYEETESDSSEPIDDDEDNNPLMRSKLAYPREDVNSPFIKSKKAKISQKIDNGHLRNSAYKISEMRLQGTHSDVFDGPLRKSHLTGREQKGNYGHHLQEYVLHDEESSLRARKLADDTGFVASSRIFFNKLETTGDDRNGLNNASLSLPKWKVTDLNVNQSKQQTGSANSSKKRGKRPVDDDLQIKNSDPSVTEMGHADIDQEPKSQKKPFTLITPTVQSGFSFSVIHLLSAVRMAMITMLPEDSLEIGGTNGVNLRDDLNMNKPELPIKSKVPSLTVQVIVNRVRSNPGDPCILETQEPLQDLVRGVLKIFSSKTAPLGAKGWKSLVSYEKTTKSWSWTGPVPQVLLENDISEEVTSPEAWLIPHKMLVKLVDAFANWLKSGQETLRQIGSLPNPPLSLMQFNSDEKERFKDLRAQKSLNTISPSTEDIRDYFRKEEFLRYSIPDRAFSYTAIDGKKSFVAPLRRCGGKPTSKARDHFMLKRDRPPHVTILCLVRDAAARLPGSIGTRADVCTLIRDSQYIVEDVSDAQVNQVVSGAMDRLHYERDPCVQFDGERKLWVYLHRDREEEDFEDDGTSSTKKWKRPKKEVPEEPFEQEMVSLAYHEEGEQSGFHLDSDLNDKPSLGNEHIATEPLSYDGNHKMKDNVRIGNGLELGEQNGLNLGSDLDAKPSYGDEFEAIQSLCYDGNHRVGDNVEIGGGSELGVMQQSSTMDWESLGLNCTRDNEFLCQENSKHDDFSDGVVCPQASQEFS